MAPISPRPGARLADLAAGPSATGPAPDRGVSIHISVIVPAHNNISELAKCLGALRSAADSFTELIVVDDASTDDVSSVAAKSGARVLRLNQNAGPAAARNYGVRYAHGQVLFFVDSDVIVAGDAIRRVRIVLEGQGEFSAVFGSYDSSPAAPGLVSQYRNLFHHFTHQTAKTEAATFWAGCGGVTRAAFERVGGFDERRFRRPSIEDIELGHRLCQAGYRILLDKSLQGTHLKRWTLWSGLRADLVYRAIPWSRLILESGHLPNDLNVQRSQRVSVALTGLSGLFFAASPLRPAFLVLAFSCIAAIVIINRDLYAFFRRVRGLLFATTCIPLHLLYYMCCGIGYQYVWLFRTLKSAAARRHGQADPA